jgi:hypothetical protein
MADDSKPTPAERAEMERARAEAARDKQEEKAIEDSKKPYVPEVLKGVVRKASGGSIRGGGCETKGKTKGRMV